MSDIIYEKKDHVAWAAFDIVDDFLYLVDLEKASGQLTFQFHYLSATLHHPDSTK